jgi:hypothetical protein
VQAATLVPDDLADYIEAIALDDSGAIYVVGKTTSEYFPLVNPFQSTYGGGESDGFIAVFAPDGQSLQYSTYLGSSYPSPTDVTLNELAGTTSNNFSFLPTWLWLAAGLLFFFIASLFLGRIVGQHKNGQ